MNFLMFYIERRTLYFSSAVQKHSGTFDNRKYEKLSYPKKAENVRPHSSNSMENATPSSGTSPLASRKEVPRPCM